MIILRPYSNTSNFACLDLNLKMNTRHAP
uniref:Uncharacterized protein n=1 Tax=Rhizophora mucronata TaxID=61149 RepID=A0A2P2R113_RHIMU